VKSPKNTLSLKARKNTQREEFDLVMGDGTGSTTAAWQLATCIYTVGAAMSVKLVI
jgi:hypothetical protein